MLKKALFSLFILNIISIFSQTNSGSFTGNIESNFQILKADSLIGAKLPAEKALLNSYMNVFYTNGNFKAGMRFESYLPRINGYPNMFSGSGIGMRYVQYASQFVDVTLGNFYEQFGSGLLFRSYENRQLGYDNAMDGMRLIVRPKPGVTLKGVYGYQRLSFVDGKIQHADGIVRGMDGEVHINELVKFMNEKKFDVTIGGTFVSKFQKDDDENLVLPQNVGSYGGRLKLKYGKLFLDGEYVMKENDPSADNGKNYNTGHACLINAGYSQKGFGVNFSAKSTDNMSYRSDRNQNLANALINYIPSLNKTHTYNLVSSLYPYATQLQGEVAFQGDLIYTFKKDSKIGGKTGMTIMGNMSTTYRPMRHSVAGQVNDSSGITYKGKLFDMSDSLYWQDINVSINKKINKKLNFILSYYNIKINNDVSKVAIAKGIINSHINVLEVGYKINKNNAFRTELQSLITKVDRGNWATLLFEYNWKSNWCFSVMDQYNYGNPNTKLQIHYIVGSFSYVHESTTFIVSVGRQRAGMFCVGGVCRVVPAQNGLTFTFTHSF
ncbi:MAG: hypothetical protein HYR91_04780 [Flavobacteriia bacterium]|nr:hypothetical protein [Flavobacteriia bacterium]